MFASGQPSHKPDHVTIVYHPRVKEVFLFLEENCVDQVDGTQSKRHLCTAYFAPVYRVLFSRESLLLTPNVGSCEVVLGLGLILSAVVHLVVFFFNVVKIANRHPKRTKCQV